MWRLVICLCCAIAHPRLALAESLVATRPISGGTILAPQDVAQVAAAIPGAVTLAEEAVGKQTRRAILPGRPILLRDLGAPVVIARNARVLMRYAIGDLQITAEGRALDKAEVGAVIRVMSLSSRSIVSARVAADGSVVVEGP